ncbi:ribonuclease HII [Lujinxingia litoralis]|uniref:Ribonuclease HII n=1 Tax=Lujinxingia litoralis TaxID=2211119 RepID=A0A328C7X3_9DELT|nr:ribonuclease HII [Lujinxingia litoralis]RAL22918.1 ribonuclease HII [Lujinxingia litoralis]
MSQQFLFTASEPRIGELEELMRSRGHLHIIGVDEAGRGPLAGPVHAAAYWWSLEPGQEARWSGLNDSKKMRESQREALFDALCAEPARFELATSSAERIDAINILQATFEAMRSAVETLVRQRGQRPDLVVVDGNMIIPELDLPQQAIVKGDGRSLAIAAASVIAKVSRDRVMRQAEERWPGYGFSGHKGYGTAAHREAIATLGPTPLHRKSFKGVREHLEKSLE